MTIRQYTQAPVSTHSDTQMPDSPHGNRRLAGIGVILIFAAIVTSSVLVQFRQSLPLLPSSSSTLVVTATMARKNSLIPIGAPLSGFTAYHSNLLPIALFQSDTWQTDASTLFVMGASQPALTSHPASSPLPAMQITLLPASTATQSVIPDLANIFAAQQQSSYTMTHAQYATTIQGRSWTAIDATVSQNGIGIATKIYLTQEHGYTVLVITESLGITFEQTNTQDFIPMLKSLAVVSNP